MSAIGLKLEIERRRDGLVLAHKSYPVNSFIRQAAQALRRLHGFSTTARNTAGDNVTMGNFGSVQSLHVLAGAGVTSWGVQLGTGSTPPNRDDFVIEELILHGADPGRLQYGAVEVHPVASLDSTGFALSIERVFDNNSGGLITAREVTVVFRSSAPGGDFNFLMLRDSINEPIAHGENLTARYVWEFLVG